MKSDIEKALETNYQRFDNPSMEFEPDGDDKPTFPLIPTVDHVPAVKNSEEPNVKQNSQDDYEYARNLAMTMLEQQQHLVKAMVNLCNAVPSARAFEVVNQMMKTTMDMSKDLMDLPKSLREAQGIKSSDKPEKTGGDTYVFAGGPTEILEKLAKAAKAEKNARERIIDITPESSDE